MRFQVLGPVLAIGDDGPLRIAGRVRKAVLAALVLRHQDVVAADVLADIVWGDNPPASAQNTLQAHVSRLRRAMGEAGHLIEWAAPGYVLRAPPEDIDLVRFERLAAEGRAALASGSAAQAADLLSEALGLWRGRALADLVGIDFADRESSRLEELRLTVLEDRLEADLAVGRHQLLVAELEALTAEHPLRERFGGQLMLAMYRAGRQGEALRAYQRLRSHLAEELGIEPSRALQQLEGSILLQEPHLELLPPEPTPVPAAPHPVGGAVAGRSTATQPPPPIAPLPAPAQMARRGPFVGRAGEVARVVELVERAPQQGLAVALVSGEPGIGKSRMAGEVAALATERGAVVLWGRCDEDLATPYQPFAEALAQHIPRLDDDELADVVGEGTAVVRLLPSLASRLGRGVAPSDTEVDRRELFDAVAGLIRTATRCGPALLVIDDLHSADPSTIAAARYVLRTLVDAPLVILGTYRDTDLTPSHPTRSLLADLAAEPAVVTIALDGLDEASLGELSVHLLPDEKLRDEVVDLVRKQSGGNPLLCGQLLRHLAEVGLRTGYDAPLPGPLSDDPATGRGRGVVPDAVAAIVEHRLAGLSPRAALALRTAAVVGSQFDFDVVESVLERSGAQAGDVLDDMEEGLAARLLDEVPDQPGRFRFVHSVVRDSLYGALSAARRARLHQQVAEAIACSGATAVEVANHLLAGMRTGQPDAVAWLLRAAEEQEAVLAFEDAAESLRRAIAALDLSSRPNRGLRARLWLFLGAMAEAVGDTLASRGHYAEAASDARAAHDPEALADIAMRRAAYAHGGVPDPLTAQLLTDALELIGARDLRRRALLLAVLAFYRALNEGQGWAADPLAAEGSALAATLDDPTLLVDVYEARALVALGSPDLHLQREIDELLARLAGSYDRTRSVWAGAHRRADRSVLLRHRAVTCLQAGDVAGFDADHARLAAIAEERGDWLLTSTVTMWDAMRAHLAGRLDDADRASEELLARAGHDVNFANSWAGMQLQLARDRGQVHAWAPLVADVAARTPGLALLQALHALTQAEVGHLDDARAVLDRAPLADVAAVARGVGSPGTLAALAETVSLLGDGHRVAAVEAALLPYAGQALVVVWGAYCAGTADRYLGMLAAADRRWDEVEQRFAAALALETGIGAEVFAVRTRAWWARASAARGRPGDLSLAARLRREAVTAAARLGMAVPLPHESLDLRGGEAYGVETGQTARLLSRGR